MEFIEKLDLPALQARGHVLELATSLYTSLREWTASPAPTARPAAPERAWSVFSVESGSYLAQGAGAHFDHIRPIHHDNTHNTSHTGFKGTKVYQTLSKFGFPTRPKEDDVYVRERADSGDSDRTIRFDALAVDNRLVVPKEDWDSWESLLTSVRRITDRLRHFERDALICNPPHPSVYPVLPDFPAPYALAVPISPTTRENTPSWLDFYTYLTKQLTSLNAVWEGLRMKAMAEVEEATRLRLHLARKEIRREVYAHKKEVSADLHWDWEAKAHQTVQGVPLDGPAGPFTPVDFPQTSAQDAPRGPKVSSMSGRVFCNRKPKIYRPEELRTWVDEVDGAKQEGNIRRKLERKSKIIGADDSIEHMIQDFEAFENQLKRGGTTNSRRTASTLPRTAKATFQEMRSHHPDQPVTAAQNTVVFPTIHIQPPSDESSPRTSKSSTQPPTPPPKPKARKNRPVSPIEPPTPKRRRSSAEFGASSSSPATPIASRRPRSARPAPTRRRSSNLPVASPTSTFFGGEPIPESAQDVHMSSVQETLPLVSPPKLRVKPLELATLSSSSSIKQVDEHTLELAASPDGRGTIPSAGTGSTLWNTHPGIESPYYKIEPSTFEDYPTIPSMGSSAGSTPSSPASYSEDPAFVLQKPTPLDLSELYMPSLHPVRDVHAFFLNSNTWAEPPNMMIATKLSDSPEPLYAHIEQCSTSGSSFNQSNRRGPASSVQSSSISGDYVSARSRFSDPPTLSETSSRFVSAPPEFGPKASSRPGGPRHRKTLSSEGATFVQPLSPWTPGATVLDELDRHTACLTPKASKYAELNNTTDNTQPSNENDEHDDDNDTYRHEDDADDYYTEQKYTIPQTHEPSSRFPASSRSSSPRHPSRYATPTRSFISSGRSSPLFSVGTGTNNSDHRVKLEEDTDSVVTNSYSHMSTRSLPKSEDMCYSAKPKHTEGCGHCHRHVVEKSREERYCDGGCKSRGKAHTVVTKTRHSRHRDGSRPKAGEPFQVKISAVLDAHGDVKVEKVKTKWTTHSRS